MKGEKGEDPEEKKDFDEYDGCTEECTVGTEKDDAVV